MGKCICSTSVCIMLCMHLEDEVGAATKFFKPLRATPLHWPVVAATATSATFLNRETATRYSATPLPLPVPLTQPKTAKARRQPAGETADPLSS